MPNENATEPYKKILIMTTAAATTAVAVSAMKQGNRTPNIQASNATGFNKHGTSVPCPANGHLPTP